MESENLKSSILYGIMVFSISKAIAISFLTCREILELSDPIRTKYWQFSIASVIHSVKSAPLGMSRVAIQHGIPLLSK